MKYLLILSCVILSSCSILKDAGPLVKPASFVIGQSIVDGSKNPKKDYEQIQKVAQFLETLSNALVDELSKDDFIAISVIDDQDKKWVSLGEQLWDVYKAKLSQSTLDKVSASSIVLKDMAAGLKSVYLTSGK